MSRNRVRLFNDLTDVQVSQRLQAWRHLAGRFDSYSSYVDDHNSELVDKTIKSAQKLRDHNYDNPRLELKRWHQLYDQVKSRLALTRREACENGKIYIDQAKSLYQGKTTKEQFSIKVLGNIEVETVPGLGRQLPYGTYRVFLQREGEDNQVELTGATVSKDSYY